MSQTAMNPKGAPLQTPTTTAEDRPLIWINGQLVPRSQAKISVYDHGLLYGDGIFEGIRIYRGRIFKLQQHMDRLWECTKKIGLEIPISREEMIHILRRCVEANELTEGYIRLVITRGEGTLGLNPYKCPTPGIICIADSIELFPPALYEAGMTVVVAKRPRIPVQCLDPRIKSLNYLNNVLAKVEALDRGLLEVIMLNIDGYVAEGSGDNIFIVKDGKVLTPPAEVGILEGVTRRFVMEELCPKLGLVCEEKLMRLDEVLAADEIFLTGSAAEIIGVAGVINGDKEIAITDGEGSITAKLRQAFRDVVTGDDVPED